MDSMPNTPAIYPHFEIIQYEDLSTRVFYMAQDKFVDISDAVEINSEIRLQSHGYHIINLKGFCLIKEG